MGTECMSGSMPCLCPRHSPTRLLVLALLVAACCTELLLGVVSEATRSGGGGGRGGGAPTGPVYSERLYIVLMKSLPPAAQLEEKLPSLIFSNDTVLRNIATSFYHSESLADTDGLFSGSRSRSRSSGGIAGRSFLHSQTTHAYAAHLTQLQTSTLTSAGIPSTRLVTSYKYLLNGFAAKLSPEEAERLRSNPSVASVHRNQMYYTLTNRSPQFLKLPDSLWKSAGGRVNAGEDVIVGVLDTGIWPEHPSFSDKTPKRYGPVPSWWRGGCQATPDFPASKCNRKLIGARYFVRGWLAETGRFDSSSDYLSPRDSESHGSWCASAAAGNSRVNGSLVGKSIGQISGMAPRARVASYKVCWQNSVSQFCTSIDIFSGLERALLDGVDVISMSLGAIGPGFIFSPMDSASLIAALNGIVVVAAAGNSGESPPFKPYTQMSNYAPWFITVAASTIDRSFSLGARLGNGVRVVGGGLTPGNASTVSRLLVLSTSCARNPVNNASRTRANLCLKGSLNATRCRGAIVVCTRGNNTRIQKSEVVAAAGGVGVIVVNPNAAQSDTLVEAFVIPGMLVSFAEGEQIKAYVRQARRPVATIETQVQTWAPAAPAVASFSSRGPIVNPAMRTIPEFGPSPHTLKPDVAAPGLNLIAAVPPPKGAPVGRSQVAMYSGTSMATPHVAGIAALLKQRWPTWSPARIKSVLMTTASTVNNRGQPIKMEGSGRVATPFAFGAGQVNPPRMLNPGLVYDVRQTEYFAFLNGINPDAVKGSFQLPFSPPPILGYDLNQPYICVGLLRRSVTVTRRATNVGGPAVYTASVVAPQGVGVVVSPARLSLADGAIATFTVQLTVKVSAPGWKFGSLTWVSSRRVAVRSVIAVQPLSVT